jgi:hypothetical protein
MVVGNTNVTVEHLKVPFEDIVIPMLYCLFSVIWRLALKVTNLENVNCTGLL